MPGWGAELWGVDAWGSYHEHTPVHIPTSEEFTSADASNTQLSIFLDYIEVEATQGYPWITYEAETNRLLISSTDAFIASEVLVPADNSWTLEVDIQPTSLPPTFADLNSNRVFFGAFNSHGYGGGIALSRQGISVVSTFIGEAYAIPGSMNVLPEGSDFYTVRIVMDEGVMSIYITPTALLPATGHMLKYTTGGFESPEGARDGVLIDLQGSVTQTMTIGLRALRFNGHVALFPNKKPVADPGPDQGVSKNATVVYDGSGSYDPEGQPLTYKWSLQSAPRGSVFRTDISGVSFPNTTEGVTGIASMSWDGSAFDGVRLIDGTDRIFTSPIQWYMGGSPYAQVYDPRNNTWSLITDSPSLPSFAPVALLQDGRVLLAGGCDAFNSPAYTSCFIYDPASNSIAATGSLNSVRGTYALVTLHDGRVLASGGKADPTGCELYDPATGTWSVTDSMAHGRFAHKMCVLPDGKVLAVGGSNVTTVCELYDPETETWSETGSTLNRLYLPAVALLHSGDVFVYGGGCDGSDAEWMPGDKVQRYNTATGTFSEITTLAVPMFAATTSVLLDGRVLITEGCDWQGGSHVINIYDPRDGTFTPYDSNSQYRFWGFAVTLSDGTVAYGGGYAAGINFNSQDCHKYYLADEDYQHRLYAYTSDTFSVEALPLLQPGDSIILVATVFEAGQYLDKPFSFTVAVGDPPVWEVTPLSGGKYLRKEGVFGRYLTVEEVVPWASFLGFGQVYALHSATYFSDRTARVTSAVPDVTGIFETHLTVNDGELDSIPVRNLLDVRLTTLTFGVIPDVSFIWAHLTDFMNMLEDRGSVEAVWTSFAQAAASVLLSAWQIDYNKSLKDIQRVTQKKWLSYNNMLGADSSAKIDWEHNTVESDVIHWYATPGWNYGSFSTFEVRSLETGDTVRVANTWSYPGDPPHRSMEYKYGRLYFDPWPIWSVIRGPYGEYDYSPSRMQERLAFYDVTFCEWRAWNLLVVSDSVVSVPRLQKDLSEFYYSEIPATHHYGDDERYRTTIRTNEYWFRDSWDSPWTRRRYRSVHFYYGVDVGPYSSKFWAEVTYIDNQPTIEDNFGSLVGLSLSDVTTRAPNLDYLSAVRGLWYAYFRGPSLHTVQIGTQILLGMPFAEEEGTVESINLYFGAGKGRMLLRDTVDTTIVRSYIFQLLPYVDPAASLAVNKNTGLPIAVGDVVSQFEPLCNGVDVVDYVKDPSWPRAYGSLFKEVEKLFRFIVRSNVDTFRQADLSFAIQFVKKIKPHYTKLLFVLLKQLKEEKVIEVGDSNPIRVKKLNVTSADQLNVGGYRWDDNIAGEPFPAPHVGQDDGRCQQAYDRSTNDLTIVGVQFDIETPWTSSSQTLGYGTTLSFNDWSTPEGSLGVVHPTVAGTRYVTFDTPRPCIGQIIVASLQTQSTEGAIVDIWADGGSPVQVTWFLSDGSTLTGSVPITGPGPVYVGVTTPIGARQVTVVSTWAEVTVPFTPSMTELPDRPFVILGALVGGLYYESVAMFLLGVSGLQEGGPPPSPIVCRGQSLSVLASYSSDYDEPPLPPYMYFDELTAGEMVIGLRLSDGTTLTQVITAAYLAGQLGHVVRGTTTAEGSVFLPTVSAESLEFLHDRPFLFPFDRSSVLVGWTTSDGELHHDSIWAYDDGGGVDLLPLSGPDSLAPAPYGPLVGVVHYDVALAAGTYHRRWWL